MTVLTETFRGGETLGTRFAALRARMTDAAAKRKMYRTTYNELAELNDRELSDLGIHRSEIARIALQAAYGA